ncbi:Trk system potassium transporter TrkA [Peptoniphilus mikwangii]|uniref:Trk system potassium transporter TrkA n=1 Tax=Peptoniphilus mikwangii TaxID=1354300 RepID=UPI00041FB577|nr:Trk system potassium transporter TrkA [Peptoniphilus mikwangii]
MKILIVGAGRVGQKIIKSLVDENYELTIIDNDNKALSEIEKSPHIKTLLGDGLNRELIMTLNISEYEFIVAATNSDKTNILVSTLAKTLGAKYTIARINQADSVEQLLYLRDSLGIDYIVNPARETVKEIETILKSDINYQADSFGRGKIEVVGHNVKLDKSFEGLKIKDIGSLSTILVVAIERKNNLIIPNGDTIIESGDYLYLMGLTKDISNFKMKHFQIYNKKRKRVVIVGGGGISEQLASSLQDHDITIIEKDRKKADELRRKMSNVFIINKDFSGAEFFDESQIEQCDVFITLTENDELNMVLGMMALKLSINQVMVKATSLNYSKLLDGLDFTAVLNPLTITSNKISKKLRFDRGISIYLAFNGEAEVSEIKLSDNSPVIGKSLMELEIPKGVLIGGIIRKDNTAVVPRGKTVFEKGDTIVAFYKNENKKGLEKFINPGLNRGFLSDLWYS